MARLAHADVVAPRRCPHLAALSAVTHRALVAQEVRAGAAIAQAERLVNAAALRSVAALTLREVEAWLAWRMRAFPCGV